MLCGWHYGELTGYQMRAQFTICAKRLAASEQGDRRGELESQARTSARGRECCGAPSLRRAKDAVWVAARS
jgi:hypothetical protein